MTSGPGYHGTASACTFWLGCRASAAYQRTRPPSTRRTTASPRAHPSRERPATGTASRPARDRAPCRRQGSTARPRRATRQTGEVARSEARAPQLVERHQRRRRIAAAAAQSRLRRDALFDCDVHAAHLTVAAAGGPQGLRRTPHQVAPVGRHVGGGALERERAAPSAKHETVVQRQRLEHRAQVVVAIGAASDNPQIEVDLGVRASDQRRHEPDRSRNGPA